MKSKIIVAVIIIASAAALGFVRGNRATNVKSLQLNVKDLSNNKLFLAGPVYADFNRELSAALKGKSDAERAAMESIRPFSVLLTNKNERSVIAYNLKWQIVKDDGSVITQYDSYIEPGRLMGSDQVADEAGQGDTLKANDSKLLSWGTLKEEAEIRADYSASNDAKTSGPDSSNGQSAPTLQKLKAATAGTSNLTVSLEAAVFEDGTFVGAGGQDFSAKLQAQLKARRDLLRKLHFEFFKGKAPKEILDEVQRVAEGPEGSTLTDSSPEGSYKYFRRLYANEVISIRNAYAGDDKKAILRAIEPLVTKWANLKSRDAVPSKE
jgi:hypothetical protein